MKKLGLFAILSFFLAGILSAADIQPPNPFEKYDKDLKKTEEKLTEEKKAKAQDKKKVTKLTEDLDKIKERKDKELKRLTKDFETEKEKLIGEIDKAMEKDKNADVKVKQARVDYLDKMLQYYNDLYNGKTAEFPKDPSKTPPANKDAAKEGAKTDTPPALDPMANKPADAAEKAKKALSGDLAK